MKEYLAKLLKALAEKNQAMQTALTKSADAGTTPDDETEQEIQQLEKDIAAIKVNIKRTEDQIAEIEKATQTAKPVQGQDPQQATQSADPNAHQPAQVKSNLPKGVGLALVIKANALAHKERSNTFDILKAWNVPQEVINFAKVKANIGTTTSADFASALVDQQNLTNEFIELLRPATIIGQLSGFRNVPFNVKIPTQTGSTSVQWVGESKAKPTTDMKFSNINLSST